MKTCIARAPQKALRMKINTETENGFLFIVNTAVLLYGRRIHALSARLQANQGGIL
jgi:hypothetical protein